MRRALSDDVASYLRHAIIAGEYAAGDPVHAEVVGEAMEISATPVREALQALRVEGFLQMIPRKGFTVAPLAPDDIRDIFEAHALIAGELAARTALAATDAELGALGRLHREVVRAAAAGDAAALEQRNDEFHRLVYRLSGSERLRRSLGSFVKYVPRAFYAHVEDGPATTVDDHSVVLAALLERDAEGARAAMAQHLRNGGEKLAGFFAATRERQAGATER